jgi:hypothetical protein
MNVTEDEGRVTVKVDEKTGLDIEVVEELGTICKQSVLGR